MEDFTARLDKSLSLIKPHLLEWTFETIGMLPAKALRRSVRSIVEVLKKRKLVKPHCLTCGGLFASLRLVQTHLAETRGHIYVLKALKKEVKRAKRLIGLAKVLAEEVVQFEDQLHILRVGIALKVATLVRLRGDAKFEKKVNKIIKGL
jgi:hypothetical protein